MAGTKTIYLPTVGPIGASLKVRRKRAEAALKRLQAERRKGMKPKNAPYGVGKGWPSVISQARDIVRNLKTAETAVYNSCPNPWDNTFVLERPKKSNP